MKIGQKVTFTEKYRNWNFDFGYLNSFITNFNPPNLNKIYTIRKFEESPREGIIVYFNEICMGFNKNTQQEIGVPVNSIRPIDELFAESIIESLEYEFQNIPLPQLV